MVHPVVFSSAGAIMARLNISKDAIYFPAGKRKGDKLGSASRLHTLQASNMTTIPLQNDRQRPELFHRPLGLWNPLISKKLHVKNQSKLQSEHNIVSSLNTFAIVYTFMSHQNPLVRQKLHVRNQRKLQSDHRLLDFPN